MSAVLDRKEPVGETSQEDSDFPECLRTYQPFIMLWSEKRSEQGVQETNRHFSDNYHGITDVNYSMHETTSLTRDDSGSGAVIVDSNFS